MADETVKNGVSEGVEGGEGGDAIDGNTAAGTSVSAGGKKNKKGKNKNKASSGEAGPATGANLSADQQEKLKKAMEMLNLQSQGGGVSLSVIVLLEPANIPTLQVRPRVRRRRPRSLTSSGRPSPSRPLTRWSPATSASVQTWPLRR